MADFNTAPYFDDFDEAKKFLKILFRPGYAVQTRELNQAQTILQDQVSKFGKHIFKEGSVVIPGELSVLRKPYVKVSPIIQRVVTENGVEQSIVDIDPGSDTAVAAQEIVGKTLTGSNGATALAQLWQARDVENNIPQGFIIDYQSSTDDGETVTFEPSETLRVKISETDADNFTEYRLTVLSAIDDPIGYGVTAELQRGIYFLRGHFVLVDADKIIVNAYSTQEPSTVGFIINENFVTPEQDSTLKDNANGTYNYAAPGAHRYQIDATLTSKPLTVTTDSDGNEVVEPVQDPNYVEVTQLKNGVEQEHVVNTEYSQLERTLARRTFDESGNYSVTPFRVQVKEKRSNNRGIWTPGRYYLQGDIVTDGGFNYVAQNSNNAGSISPSSLIGDSIENRSDGNVVWSYEPNPRFNGGDTTDLDQSQEEAEKQESQLTIIVEPGKAYVRGLEVETISPSRIDISKARSSEIVKNDSLGTRLGNYIRVKNINGIPDIQSLESVTLRNVTADDNADGIDIGTARIRGLEQFGSDEYWLYVFDLKLNQNACFANCVKQIRNDNFTADIVNVNESDSQGSVSSAGTTITGSGTRFTSALDVNDYIEIDDVFYRVTAINSNVELTVNTAPSVDFDNEAYRIVRTKINNPKSQLVIYPTYYNAVETVKNEQGVSEVEYTVVQKFVETAVGGTVTISRTSAVNSGGSGIGTRFSTSLLPQEIIVTQSSGSIVPLDGSPSSLVETTEDSITISGLPDPDGEYTIFAPVVKEDSQKSKEKTKTLQTTELAINDLDALKSRVISLGKADIFRVIRITMFSGENEIDITKWFDLDNGQRDAYYGVGSIVRKSEYTAPSNPIRIDFEYFTHGSTGDYFSIDSYPVKDVDIPTYETENGTISLRNALDFRPVIDDSGTSFTGTGSSISLPPKPGTELTATYSFYKGRSDRIAINSKGDIIDVTGTASLDPKLPEPVSETMDIASLEVPAYTYSPDDVSVVKIDNRRYTMRDIGDLERRIDRLEYYTSLNLLEQKAASIEIPDDDDPRFNRFKNGFIVDNFAGHNTGDTSAPDYRASIDMERQELRPTVYSDNVELIESVSRPSDRAAAGYQVTGDVITLPYTQTTYINQSFATNVENINPYAVFTFIGAVSLNPFSDQWFETESLPAIINDVEGNFNAVRDRAAEAGALGTVWNNWQTQWTGTRTDWNFVREGHGGFNQTIRETQERRTGIQTTVRATFEREVVDERVVSTSTIPFIRARSVAFLARNLKLGTRIFPYFDGVDVSEYVTPASRLEYTEISGSPSIFDFETNAGADADESARRIGNDTETHLNSGDVVFVSRRGSTSYASPEASPCTAVVQLQEVRPGDESLSILVFNASGNFQPGDEIVGTISGAKGTVSTWTPRQQGDSLITNFGGDVAGVFAIPNNDEIQFRTGEREFKLLDNVNNNDFESTTRGRATYEAEGTLRRTQQTINSVRNGQVVQQRVNDTRTRSEVTQETWFDPIAQTFLIEESGGLFLTSLDLYFASVDPTVPVRLQIRDTVNGYPGSNVLPFGEVVLTPFEMSDGQPSGFGLSSRTVDLSSVDGAPISIGLAPDSPVRFNFKAPVYLQEGEEYCFVLLSDSNNYHVWVSDLGGVDSFSIQGEQNQVSEQPYLGSFFKSQNASTWTPDQNRDIKFRINRAKFQNLTSTITGPDGREESINTTALTPGGIATVHNSRVDTDQLESDPLFTRSGSPYIRILHKNHGFTIGSRVTISGLETGVYAGFTDTQINDTHEIVHVDHDSYVIKILTEENNEQTASETTRTGGNNIRATRNVQFDGVQPIIPVQSFSDTRVDYIARTLSGQTVFGFENPYIRDTEGVELNANENNFFNSPRLIASDDNEVPSGNDSEKSFELDIRMFSTKDNLSPVIDTSRLSLITFRNRVSSPNLDAATYIPGGDTQDKLSGFDLVNIITNNTDITFSDNQILTENEVSQSAFNELEIGQVLKISDSDNDENNGRYTITSISDGGSIVEVDPAFAVNESPAGGSDGIINISVYNNYVDEISPSAGTTAAKYMTQRVDLSEAAANSTAVDIRFAANVPTGASIVAYYKTKLSADDTRFADIPWTRAGAVLPTDTDGFVDQEFNITNIPTFDIVSVKLVMISESSANVPKAKDLIIIANA